MADALAELWDAVYRVPQVLGMGDHWPLAPHEAQALGKATDNLIRSIPRGRRSALAKQIMRLLPWISFAATVYIITYPRVVVSQYAGNAKGVRAGANGPGVHDQAPAGAARGVATWADPAAVARLGGTFFS